MGKHDHRAGPSATAPRTQDSAGTRRAREGGQHRDLDARHRHLHPHARECRGKERAWQQDQYGSFRLALVRRRPRPRCGLRSRRVFHPRTAKVKAVDPASDANATIDRRTASSRKNVTSLSRLPCRDHSLWSRESGRGSIGSVGPAPTRLRARSGCRQQPISGRFHPPRGVSAEIGPSPHPAMSATGAVARAAGRRAPCSPR